MKKIQSIDGFLLWVAAVAALYYVTDVIAQVITRFF
jgi:hypothetical protein